ncbi:LysR family transcriptional regulator [Thalassospira lucentensis]|uniref:LysR family transcriptional regulator n=1 Tax=Thalassospira lucentensis TaxID=168935 RepID=UPI0003B3B825|nr:LysR family transcriptional regulator [Thalassospira lucentensis]RCK21959.1 LysR family transcriptional regulator [Thalassospira lucentensis MCCC 1A00383 = DSM 14000]
MQTPLDLKLLTTFVRAAHSGTLSATAIQVGRTQSTVTMQIQRLEETLGQSLFHRSGSGVHLTGHGERFLGYAERILKLQDEALSAFSDHGLRGAITFGCPEDYLIAFFPALLKSFGTIYPDIEIKVVSAPTPDLHRLLHARQIDMALVSIADPTATDIARTEQLAWVGSKPTLELHDFGTGIGDEDNTDRATSTPIPLALAASNALDHKAACDAMDAAHMPYKISYASNSLAGLIAVARSGLAISVMMQKAVPSDLYILKSPLPPLPRLGLKVATGEGPQSLMIGAFGDHIGKLLPFL